MWGGSSSNRHVGRLFSLKVDGFSSKIRFFLSLGSTTADIIIVRQYWLCCLPRTLTQGWNDQDHFCLIRLFFQVTGSVETLVSCSPALMCGGATVTDAVLLFLTFLYIFSVRWFLSALNFWFCWDFVDLICFPSVCCPSVFHPLVTVTQFPFCRYSVFFCGLIPSVSYQRRPS